MSDTTPDGRASAAEPGAPARAGPRPVLLFDGLCGFCNGLVRALLRVDDRGVFRYAPLAGGFAAETFERHPDLRGADSLVLVEVGESSDSAVYVRSDAVLGVARHLGGAWRLLGALSAIPRPLRDHAYDLVARHRRRLAGRLHVCPLPKADVRSRFLD